MPDRRGENLALYEPDLFTWLFKKLVAYDDVRKALTVFAAIGFFKLTWSDSARPGIGEWSLQFSPKTLTGF